MIYPENSEIEKRTEEPEPRQPLLDGTVHLGDADDESSPRVKGLIELLGSFIDRRVRE